MSEDYKSFVFDVSRAETLVEDTIFYPLRKENEDNSKLIKAGTSVSTIYSVSISFKSNKKLSGQEIQNITNSIQAYFTLYGEKAIDEPKLEKFVKRFTNISVEVSINNMRKQSQVGFRPGVKMITKFKYYTKQNTINV